MAEAEQPEPNEDFLFKGEKIDCKKELLNEYVFVYGGNCMVEFEFKKVGDKWNSIKVKKEAAIRIIRNEDCVDGWERTAEKLIQLNHNNILKLFGYEDDIANGLRYFALELYSATLYHYCNDMYKGPMPNESQVLYQITNGIDHLHGEGMIHGDLNPLNVVVAAQSLPVRMKIADSGLSKFSYNKHLPESAKEEETFDVRTSSTRKSLELCQSKYWTLRGKTNVIGKHIDDDIVAAGCILFYYLKRGEHLFGDDLESILTNLKYKNPVNLKGLDENCVAYEVLQDMIIPPSNGLNGLRGANAKFKETLSLKVDLTKFLGEGSFGKVYGGMYEGDPVAVKQMTTTTSEKETIQREMSKHIELNHVNVVKLFDVTDCPETKFTHMVLELCAGTLKDYCENKYNGPMPPDELVLYQIANGLHYIHSRDLVHRDIKPDNILISMTTPVQMKVSGLSFVKKTRQDQFSQSVICGALLWMAPERLKFFNDPDINMPVVLPEGTIKSDTFSSGCVFFYFLTRGLHPFGNNVTAPANILQNKPVEFVNYMKNNKISEILADVIKGMIKGKEEERTGLPEVIKELATSLSQMDQIKCQLREVNVPLDEDFYYFSFHPTKEILACASEKELIFFTAENSSIPFSNWRKQVQSLHRNFNPYRVDALEWNMNGTQLAVCYNCNTLVVWNYPECDILLQKKHSAKFNKIEWNPTRPNVLATFSECCSWNDVYLWDSSTGDVITTIDTETFWSVKWISGNRIAVCSHGVIYIFEMDESHSTTITRIVKQIRQMCMEMKWNERTQYLASCEGKQIKIWSMDSDEPIYCLWPQMPITIFAWRPCVRNEDHLDGIEMARTSPENFYMVYVTRKSLSDDSDEYCLNIWNPLENEQKPRLLYSFKYRFNFIAFSPDGRFFATGSDAKLVIWSAEEWKPIYTHHKIDSYLGDSVSWLCSTTSTNIFENKLIQKSSFHEIPELIEFTFEESESSAKSEEDYMDLK